MPRFTVLETTALFSNRIKYDYLFEMEMWLKGIERFFDLDCLPLSAFERSHASLKNYIEEVAVVRQGIGHLALVTTHLLGEGKEDLASFLLYLDSQVSRGTAQPDSPRRKSSAEAELAARRRELSLPMPEPEPALDEELAHVDRALAEALAALDAAGIAHVGDEEYDARHDRLITIEPVPGHPHTGGSSWQSLARGSGSIESNQLNGEIVLLGRLHGVPTPGNGNPPERKGMDTEPPSAYVFKTTNDPFAGRISYFKVYSGVMKNESTMMNFRSSTQEKLAHISVIQGKQMVPVNELHAGDIGGVAKLRETLTGDTLGDKAAPIIFPSVELPEPAITFAIEPKTRADEDKLSNGIHKLMEEDAMLRFFRDEQTKEFVIAGTGQQHIEVTVSKLKNRFHTEVNLKAPKVPYRETIRGRADVQGRHKKQTGGHGQFGDCRIKMEPLPRGGNFEFVNDIFGGSIPRNFIPAVEKGIVEAAQRGFLAGYPVVDIRVILYDGSYHDVDSNELSFKTAGRIAFKKAMEQAKPTLLEPIMKVEIEVPDEFAGSIMGDLNGRRGRIQGMDNKGGKTVIKAEVPMSEMLTYGVDLTSMTQGRGSFNMEMNHYDFVPALQQEKIIENYKKGRVGQAEEEE